MPLHSSRIMKSSGNVIGFNTGLFLNQDVYLRQPPCWIPMLYQLAVKRSKETSNGGWPD